MALTLSTPYIQGTLTGASGATVTDSSKTFTSAVVGRCFRIKTSVSNRGGQIRRITGFTTTSLTLEYAWNTTLDSGDLFYETLPQSGDGYVISGSFADIFDTTNISRLDTNHYKNVGGLILSGDYFLYDRNILFDAGNADFAAATAVKINTAACLQLGDLTQSRTTTNSCQLLITTTDSVTTNITNLFSTAGSAGDFIIYGGNLKVRTAGATPFIRFYRGSDQIVRLINVQIEGLYGGRLQGNRSAFINNKLSDSTNSFGVLSVIAPFNNSGLINNLAAYCSQAIYQALDQSLSMVLYGVVARSISSNLIQINNVQNTTTGTLEITNLDYDGSAPFFIKSNALAGSGTSKVFLYYSLQISSLLGSSLSAGKIAVFNSSSSLVTQEISSSGSYASVRLLQRTWTVAQNQSLSYSSGTLSAPYTVRFREYGYDFLEQIFAEVSPSDSTKNAGIGYTFFKNANANVTGTKADALALTNITHSSTSISIASSSPTLQDIFNSRQAYLIDNMSVASATTFNGFTLATSLSLSIASGASIATSTGKTLSVSGVVTFAVAADYSAINLSVAATGVVTFTTGGTADLRNSVFTSGSRITVAAGQILTAIVALAQVPNVIAGTGVTLISRTTIAISGLAVGSSVGLFDNNGNLLQPVTTSGSTASFSLTYPGALSYSVQARLYGRQDFSRSFTMADGSIAITALQPTDPFTALSSSAASALSQLAINYSTLKTTASADFTLSQAYDYARYSIALLANIDKPNAAISTTDGIVRSLNFDLTLTGSTTVTGTGTLAIGSKTLTLGAAQTYSFTATVNATGQVVAIAGSTTLPNFSFISGATVNRTSGTATAIIAIPQLGNPVAGGGVTIKIPDFRIFGLPAGAPSIVRVKDLTTNVIVNPTVDSSGQALVALAPGKDYEIRAKSQGYYISDFVTVNLASQTSLAFQLTQILDDAGSPVFDQGLAAIANLISVDFSTFLVSVRYSDAYPKVDINSVIRAIEIQTTTTQGVEFTAIPTYRSGKLELGRDVKTDAINPVRIQGLSTNTGDPELTFEIVLVGVPNSYSVIDRSNGKNVNVPSTVNIATASNLTATVDPQVVANSLLLAPVGTVVTGSAMAKLNRVDGLIEVDGGSDRFKAKTLETAPTGGGSSGGLTTAQDAALAQINNRVDVTLSTIKTQTDKLNFTGGDVQAVTDISTLATQISVNALPTTTTVNAIKAQTDKLTFDASSNIQAVINTSLLASKSTVDAIKLKTDLIPSQPTSVGDVQVTVSGGFTSGDRTLLAAIPSSLISTNLDAKVSNTAKPSDVQVTGGFTTADRTTLNEIPNSIAALPIPAAVGTIASAVNSILADDFAALSSAIGAIPPAPSAGSIADGVDSRLAGRFTLLATGTALTALGTSLGNSIGLIPIDTLSDTDIRLSYLTAIAATRGFVDGVTASQLSPSDSVPGYLRTSDGSINLPITKNIDGSITIGTL
jgi:hypothetical protein